MTMLLLIATTALVAVVLIDELGRALHARRRNREDRERLMDECLLAGIRMGAIAERHRILSALTEDTMDFEALAVDPADEADIDFIRPRSVVDAAERFTRDASDDAA